jgi:hypothetical protein
LKKQDYYEPWQKLTTGNLVANIKDELFIFQEASKNLEEYCLDFAEGEESDSNNNSIPNNQQREQIQEDISNLENKPNKTEQEEQDLINKKK